jgi:hypothetical protein
MKCEAGMKEKVYAGDHALLLSAFMESVKDDPRINAAHISLYVSLLYHWQEKGYENPLQVFRQEVLPLCKISGTATYHRSIKELQEYGYIRYIPSYNHFLGSLVYILPIRERAMSNKL